jgi:chemotaxis response regulator CheB
MKDPEDRTGGTGDLDGRGRSAASAGVAIRRRKIASRADGGAAVDVPAPCPPTVVGSVASAGGLSALRKLFQACPVDTGVVFVLS